MNKKSFFYTLILVTSFALTIAFFYWFFKSPYFLIVDKWAKENIVTYALLLLVYKTVGVLFPPIPGGIVTLASIPFLGWTGAFLIDSLGSLLGGSIAYFLARKYGHVVLVKTLGEEIAKKAETIKIKSNREIEGVFVYKLALGSTILEAVYYGAGYLKIGFRNFLIGSLLAQIVVGLPSFYLANNILNGENIVLTILLTLVGVSFVIFTKGRYIE